MASDVQQPFGLSFQVDALHSSSISFGRFELESLSWERRSSFSHNRYLEEVEKYARPGSVTEKKEYFEAHFRKRALLRQASSLSQAEREGSNSESGSYSTSTCEDIHRDWTHGEEPQQMVGNVCRFDESPKGSSTDGDFRRFGDGAGFTEKSHTESVSSIGDTDSVNDVDTSLKWSSLAADFGGREQDEKARDTNHLELKMEPASDTLNSVENVKCNDTVETCDNSSSHDRVLMSNIQHSVIISELGCHDQPPDVLDEQPSFGCTEEKMIDQPLKTLKEVVAKNRSSGLRSRPQGNVSVTHNNVEFKKETARKNQTPLRYRALKSMPESIAPSLRSSLRLYKESPPNLNTKSPQENGSEKELKPKRAVTPQPSTPERSESRRRPSATSTLKLMASTRKEKGQSVTQSKSTSAGAAEKRRDKTVATDIRQLSRKPDLKEKQTTCSVPNAVTRLSSREKSQAVPSFTRSAKAPSHTLQSESSTTRRSKPVSAPSDTQVFSAKKAASSRISLERSSNVHKVHNADGSSSSASHVTKINQRKAVVRGKEGAIERTLKAKDNGQITKEKLTNVTPKGGLGNSGNAVLRKSMGHCSAVGHPAVAIKATPKAAGPGRTGYPFLRKTIGH